MSRFFIDRPVFAWVVAIILMVVGTLSITSLPVAQYPSVAPPSISVTAMYPGASAKTVEDTVTQVIEQKLTGLDHLRYFESASDATGTVTITVTFDVGTDPATGVLYLSPSSLTAVTQGGTAAEHLTVTSAGGTTE